MEQLVQDLRYALRSLFRQPAFAITAIVTLALGIGATAAIFSVVNAMLLRPLPFPEPDRLVAVQNFWTKTGQTSQNVSAPDFHDWVAASGSFESIGYYTGGEWSVTVNGAADYAMAFRITPGFLSALRPRAIAGRLWTDDEQRPGGPLTVVITEDYWRRQFNGDQQAVGSTIKFGDRIHTIVGVLDAGTRFPSRADFYYPAWTTAETASRSGHNYRVLARLRDGVSIEQAQLEMDAIAARLEQQYPESNTGKRVALTALQELVVGGTRQTVYVLFGAVAVVLLIACANVANLLLAKSAIRRREMVVRAAVGASRARLVRQLLTESALLGVLAAALGVWLARFGVLALMATAPAGLPRIAEVRVDGMVLLFALGVALAASALFGLAPALQVSRVELADGMRQGGKGASTGAKTGFARSAFVIAEVALAVMLVSGAGLLARSLAALASVDMGFNADRILVVLTAVPVASRDEAPRATAFYRDLLADLEATPGIQSVSAVTSLPSRVRSTGAYAIEGLPAPTDLANSPQAVLNVVAPDYFETLGVSLASGRDFSDADRAGAPMVAIINESLARTSFPGQDPIGRRIQCGLDTLEFMTIVGVATDIRTGGPASPAQPEIFMPFEQHPMPATSMNVLVRPQAGEPQALTELVRRKVQSLDPDVPVRASTMTGTLEQATATPRFRTYLLVVFAGIALVLAAAGIYGVMSYTVSQRVPELGVRIALGATPGSIMRLVLSHGALLACAGLALGVGLALASGRLLDGLLFGVTPRDPWSLVAVTAVVAAATLAACYIPGRRAVRVDPMVALRAE
jgi:putative ABC transport system permease protein